MEHKCSFQVSFWGAGARMREKGQGHMVWTEGFDVAAFPAGGRMGFLRLGVCLALLRETLCLLWVPASG